MFHLKAFWKNLKVTDSSGGHEETLPPWQGHRAFSISPAAPVSSTMMALGGQAQGLHHLVTL
jgi:hypothetical protein